MENTKKISRKERWIRAYSRKIYKKRDRAFRREMRKEGFHMTATSFFSRPHRKSSFYNRLDKVKDPKTAFLYLLDNCYNVSSGKALFSHASRGQYYWQERSRGKDIVYFEVRRKGNYLISTRIRWVTPQHSSGVSLFIHGFLGDENDEPIKVVEKTICHPIMDVVGFIKVYKEFAPELNWDLYQ